MTAPMVPTGYAWTALVVHRIADEFRASRHPTKVSNAVLLTETWQIFGIDTSACRMSVGGREKGDRRETVAQCRAGPSPRPYVLDIRAILRGEVFRSGPPLGGQATDRTRSPVRVGGTFVEATEASVVQLAASICFGSVAVSTAALDVLMPTGMTRAFIRSGRLRTRSTCSRPSFKSAPLTST